MSIPKLTAGMTVDGQYMRELGILHGESRAVAFKHRDAYYFNALTNAQNREFKLHVIRLEEHYAATGEIQRNPDAVSHSTSKQEKGLFTEVVLGPKMISLLYETKKPRSLFLRPTRSYNEEVLYQERERLYHSWEKAYNSKSTIRLSEKNKTVSEEVQKLAKRYVETYLYKDTAPRQDSPENDVTISAELLNKEPNSVNAATPNKRLLQLKLP